MSRKTRAEERIEELDTSPTALLEQIEAMKSERDEAVAKADEYLGALQRERAEFTNFKRRTAEERQRELGLAGVDLITKVLNLADDFDRAIEIRPEELGDSSWAEGIVAIDRKLRSLLEAQGVTAMEGQGQPFDPHSQQAISYEEDANVPDGTVVKVLQRGYVIGDRVLRPALVAVARNDTPTSPEDD